MKKILIISLLTFFRLGLLRARNAGYAAARAGAKWRRAA
jgi:hypothetical protein